MVGFTVDRDWLETGPDSEVGTTWGPDLGTATQVTADTPGAMRWNAYDDDNVLYYSGWLVGDCWDVILGWGMAHAGVAYVNDDDGQCIVG